MLTSVFELLKELTALVNLIFYKPNQNWEEFEPSHPRLFINFPTDLSTQRVHGKSEQTGSP